MLRLLLRHSRAACSSTASTLHHLSAPSAASLPLRSCLLSSAVAASSRPASVLSSASPLSPSPLRFSHGFTLLTAAGIGGTRSFHRSRGLRAEAGSDSGDSVRNGSRNSRDLSSTSKGAQRERRNSRSRGRSSDRPSAEHRGRDNRSPRDHAAPGPFRFDAESRQSEELQLTLHQLRMLSHHYMHTFQTKARAIAATFTDMTQNAEWQSMRAQARQLLASLFRLSLSAASSDGRLTVDQCEKLMYACVDHRFVGEPLLVLCAAMDTGKRVSGRCLSRLLECIVKSPEWAAQSGDTAPTGAHPALTALCAGRPSPSTELRGADLALWMLEGMISPPLRDRFDVDVFVWNVVLQGLTQVPHNSPLGMQRARAFYERIPNKSPATHGTMLTGYRDAGLHSECDALQQLITADLVAGASPEVMNARLTAIHEALSRLQRQGDSAGSPQQDALLQEAAELWTAAYEQPAERMDPSVVGAVLKVLAVGSDIPLMIATIRDAIAAEPDQSLVFVDPACYSQLFHLMAKSDDPTRWMVEAKAAWDQMQERHAASATSQFFKRANQLRVDQATWNAYNRYLQRTGQREEMDRVWRDAPRELKQGNPRMFLARLVSLTEHGDLAAADRLFNEMPSFKVRPNVFHFTALIGGHRQGGRWAEAEAVWQRMLSSGIKADRVSYRELMQVYMEDGSPAQLDKIERLHSEMQTTPLRFDATDYQHLIKCAHACRLSSEARKWCDRAKEAGLWEGLDEMSQSISDRMDEWKDPPRDSKDN